MSHQQHHHHHQQPPQQQPPPQPTAQQQGLDHIILQYLSQRGYDRAKDIFQSEAKVQPLTELVYENSLEANTNISDIIMAYHDRECSPSYYQEGYVLLKRWVENSLDIYRMELQLLLWPVFAHVFISLVRKGFAHDASRFFEKFRGEHEASHGIELQALQGISLPSQLHAAVANANGQGGGVSGVSNDVVATLLTNAYQVQISAFAHALVMSFLEESQLMIIIRIINSHVRFLITSRRPLTRQEVGESLRFSGSLDDPESAAAQAHKGPIHWGVLPQIRDIHTQARREQLADAERAAAAAAASDDPMDIDNNNNSMDDDGPAAKRLKTDAAAAAVAGMSMGGYSSNIQVPKQVDESRIQLPSLETRERLRMLDDLRHRVVLSDSTLPSIACYTFLNSQHVANSICVSSHATKVAAGFADSTIRLWDLEKQSQRQRDLIINGPTAPVASSSASGAAAAANSNSQARRDEAAAAAAEKERCYTMFVGHSGPVYKVDISHDERFLLSCSEDTSIRLWSEETKSCLASYTGHNYPVWDVAFSPLGFYFASASHDRTARLWSTNRTTPLRVFAGHYSDVDCVRFHPNCNYLFTGSTDRSVRMWDIQSGQCVRVFTGHSDTITSLAVSHDGKLAASGSVDGRVQVWDLATSRRFTAINNVHDRAVTSLDFSYDNTILATGSLDQSVRLWTLEARENPLLASYDTKKTPVTFTRFTPRNLLCVGGVFQSSGGD